MRVRPSCNHPFDEKNPAPAQCPACGRVFTVSDVGSATLELPNLGVSNSTPTVDDPALFAAAAQPPSPTDGGPTKTVTGIGMTIQSGRWSPSPAELADAGGADSVLNTLHTSFLASGSVDQTIESSVIANKPGSGSVDQTIESSVIANKPGSGSVDQTIESSVIASKPGSGSVDQTIESSVITSKPGSGSVHQTLESSILGVSKPASGPRGVPLDSSHVMGQEGSSPDRTLESGSANVSRPSRPGSSPSKPTYTSKGPTLEQSLVIQPRVLRPDTSAPTPTAERIDFNLLKKLGEGGMGIVYAARQQSIRRVVALKMLKNLGGDDQEAQREKFLAEAVITGDLEHPNIVPIYDLGRDESGAIFYAMKHVKGTPWDKTIKSKSMHENLDTLMKVADAVGFAHSKQVIHRDLKPENVMLGDFGEVLLMDWGLALPLTNLPATIAMGGTPAYMAPEMAMGPVHALGFGSDIYLLGAILYEIVTGLRPHAGSTVTRCLMAAAKNDIVPTQKSGELIEIALRAMATKPDSRYPSVRVFQEAIRNYQSHVESIALGQRAAEDLEAARQSDNYDTYARALFAFQEAYSLWDGNNRAKNGIGEAALAYASSAQRKGDLDLGLSLLDEKNPAHVPMIEAMRAEQRERESRQGRLRAARRIGIGLVAAIFLIVTGAFFWIRAEADRARKAEVVAKTEKAEAVRQKGVAETQTKIAKEQEAKAIAAQKEEARQKQIALDNEQKAIAARKEEERQRQLADEARKKEEYEGYIAKIGLAAAKIEENAFDHALALINECPAPLRNWEWGRLRYLCTRDEKSFDLGQPLEAIAISPDGQRIAVGGWGSDILVLDAASGKQQAAIPTGGSYVFTLAFSPDGTQLAAGTNAKPEFVAIFDAASGKRLSGLGKHNDAVVSVAYSKNGKKLLTGSYDGTARLFDLQTGDSQLFRGHDWWVWSANFSPDEKRIVTGSQDGSAIVWNVATGESSAPFLGHRGPVYSAVFSPDGLFVATGSYDKRVLLWRPEDLQSKDLEKALNRTSDEPATPYVALDAHTASVRSVRFSADGQLLLSGGTDNAICVWDIPGRALVKTLRGHASGVSSALFAPGGDRVVSAGLDHTVKEWSIARYEEMKVLGGRVLQGHRDSILGAAFSPDGKTVVTASRDRSAKAWNVSTGQELRSYTEGHKYLASAALFFPDGKRVLTAAVDNTARIWDMAAGTQLATLEGTGTSAAVAMSKGGQWLITGSDDQTLKKWDSSGKPLGQPWQGFQSEVTALAISPDDQLILVGDGVGRCRLLKAASGEVVWEARSHSRAVSAASFLPGGQHLLTASLDNTVALREVSTGREDPKQLLKHPDAVTSLAVSADGKQVLTVCGDESVRLWDIQRAEVLKTLPKGSAPPTDAIFAPGKDRCLTTTVDNRLHLWDLQSGKEILPAGEKQTAFLDLSATTMLLWSAAFSADGKRLLTVGGAEAQLWNAADAKPLVSFSPQSAVSSVQFSKTGDQLVTGSWDNAARIWNAASGAALVKLGGVHTRFVNASVFSPDGTKVLTASDDKTVQLWDALTGQPLGKFEGHSGRVLDVAFSSKGDRVLTASDDKTARIWDAASFQVLHVLQGHTQAVLCAEFSADNQRVITGSDDTTAMLWDAATGQPLPVKLQGHTASVTSVAFTPDGLRALTGSKDITTKLWDPATGKEILTLTGHTQEITTVAVAPNGRSILTGSRDGTAIVWLTSPWTPDAPLALLPAGK